MPFDLRSLDKKLSNVIRSNWNDDINYSMMHSCYWPRSSVTAWSGLLADLMVWGAPAGTAWLEVGAERPDCWGMLWIGRQNEREREKKTFPWCLIAGYTLQYSSTQTHNYSIWSYYQTEREIEGERQTKSRPILTNIIQSKGVRLPELWLLPLTQCT